MAGDPRLLDALLDSWDRNNTILVNLLRLVPEGGMTLRATEGSPTIGRLFSHVHAVRLGFLSGDAPAFARAVPEEADETDPARLEPMLNDSAGAVRDAVRALIESGQDTKLRYDHPLLFLQHMIWHEGYHHGQIKLALKLAGQTITDKDAGRGTWGVWMRKTTGVRP